MANQLSFGIKTAPQHTTYEDIVRVWKEADQVEAVEHAWLFDHFMPLGDDPTGPCMEGWTLLPALAAQTERVRVGLMVTGNTYRHPAVLANIGATADIVSDGRLDFGIGAGWNELEHNAYGIELHPPGERIRMFGEACEVIRLMWTETAPDFDGRYYHLKGARCEPKPVQKPHPPFVIGGSGEQLTLRIVAKYAQIWNYTGASVEEFQHKSEVLESHCAKVGRNPSEIVRSVQLRANQDNPGDTVQTLRQYIDSGATHLVLYLQPPFSESIVQRVADEIIQPLKG